MKYYQIEYTHIGGSMNLQTTSIFELSKKLEKAMDDPFVNNESITIRTIELSPETRITV